MKRRTDIGFGSPEFDRSIESISKSFDSDKIIKAVDSDMDRIPSPPAPWNEKLLENSTKGFGSPDFEGSIERAEKGRKPKVDGYIPPRL